MNRESIKRKIAALLQKRVENGATKEEEESAVKKASELMSEYMIEESELNKEKKFVTKETEMIKIKSAVPVEAVLKKLLCVECFFNKYAKKQYFFGEESDVEQAIYFYRVLNNELKSATKAFRRTSFFEEKSAWLYSPHTLERDFQTGFVLGLARQVLKIINATRKKTIELTGKDLVVVRGADIEEAFKWEHPDVIKQKSRRVKDVNDDAIRMGVSIGEETEIRQGINEEERGFIK